MIDDVAGLREELHSLMAERAFRYGDFVLSSGRHSTYYVDGKQVTLDGRGLWIVSQLVLRRCHELEVDAVGGLTLGADPIAAGAAALSGAEPPCVTAFIVRKQEKAHGTGRTIEGPPLRPGTRVVLVDDALTTGGSVLQARDPVAETGATIVEAIVLIDREEGGRQNLEAAGIPVHALFARSEFPASDATVPASHG